MSFGIAKILDGKLHIHADSLLTGEDVTRHNTQNDSVLKAVLINHQVSLIFAGNVPVANDLILKLSNKIPGKYNELIAAVYQHHMENDCLTDYLIGTTLTNGPRIVAIKNGQIDKDINSGWVGTIAAFNSFQSKYLELITNSTGVVSAFDTAFQSVLLDPQVPTVGGFQFSIESIKPKGIVGNPVFLNYKKVLRMETIVNEDFMKKHGYWDTNYATVGNGGFDYSILPSISIEYPGVGFHFGYVNLGMLWIPRKFGVWPQAYPNHDGDKFVKVAQKHGAILSGITMCSHESVMKKHN